MSEADSLKSYNLQMQQVEAALTSDPANQELLTLKADLEQVIELTQTLIEGQKAAESIPAPTASSSTTSEVSVFPPSPSSSESAEDSKKKVRPHDHLKPVKHWQVGEQCQAIWTKDGQ